MKNYTILITMSINAIFMALISLAMVILEIVCGYSGFKQINGNSSVITLQEGCNQQYYNIRYNQALGTNLKVYFIVTLLSYFSCFLLLLLSACFICCCHKHHRSNGEQTRIEQLQSQYYENSTTIETYYPKMNQIISFYILVVLTLISSSIIFNFYLQLIIQSRRSTCSIRLKESQVITITLLSMVLLIISIICFILLLILCFRFKKRAEMIELENGSESYRQQVDRIIREIPESQRRVCENQDRRLHDNQDIKNSRNHPAKTIKEQDENSNNDSIKIDQIPKVQSYIYKADPQLMLQSINIQR